MGQVLLWAPREQQGKAGEFWELLPELTAQKGSRRTCIPGPRVFWAGTHGVLLEWAAREGQGPSALGEELQEYYPHS